MSPPEKQSPLRAIFAFRREELPFALLMFGYFFLVITSFWILKPVKKSTFIQFYHEGGFELLGTVMSGAQAEQLAKVLNMVVAMVAACGDVKLTPDEEEPPAVETSPEPEPETEPAE